MWLHVVKTCKNYCHELWKWPSFLWQGGLCFSSCCEQSHPPLIELMDLIATALSNLCLYKYYSWRANRLRNSKKHGALPQDWSCLADPYRRSTHNGTLRLGGAPPARKTNRTGASESLFSIKQQSFVKMLDFYSIHQCHGKSCSDCTRIDKSTQSSLT